MGGCPPPDRAAIDRPGSFLDVGCANGYLLESLARWSPHAIERYGLDFSARLVEVVAMRARGAACRPTPFGAS
jgi:2-polyprenyl-3-methyl-5-hydroxy-6-metoxy-1,4-benzoquinol methylase